jgi:hypothetical protein
MKRKLEVERTQCMNCLKWGSHTAKECDAPKSPKANYADDSSKGGKSRRKVRVDEQSEEEEDYENDAMYTDGFVKKRQLNMHVVSSNINTREVMLHAYMINTSIIMETAAIATKALRITMHMTATMSKAISTDQTR